MNKKIILGLVGIVVLGALAFVIVNIMKPSAGDTSQSNTTESSQTLVAVQACDLLTDAEAMQILGAAASGDNESNAATTDDITVDSCGYTNNAGTVAEIRSIGLMVRSATTKDGLESSKEAFAEGGAAHPTSAVAVTGYGEQAYWDPATYQLAILKDNLWIGIVYGGTNPTDNTLEDAKSVADLVLN